MPIPANVKAILDELENALTEAFEEPTPPGEPVEPPVEPVDPEPTPGPDATSPVVEILSPADGATIVKSGISTVTARITDDLGVTNAGLHIGDFLVGEMVRGANNIWSISASMSDADLGTYSFSVSAIDAAGNVGTDTHRVTVVSGSTPVPDPQPEPEEPTPDPEPEQPTPTPVSGGYGPTGQHLYPQLAGSITQTHPVAPTWTAISAQISACQSHPGVCKIAVTPGTLPSGTWSSSPSSRAGSIQNVGSTGKRIIVTPRDGFGTVKSASGTGVSFVGVKGVIFDRIDFSASVGVMIRNCETVSLGYTPYKTLLVTANGGGGVKNIDIVECVGGPEMATGVGFDRSEFKTSSGYTMDGLNFIGCYFAPNWKPNGSIAHNDTAQFEPVNGGGAITNVSFTDSVLFRSADQCIQSASTRGGKFKNSAFFGWDATSLRYPLYPGGDPATLDNTLNGTWQDIAAEDILVGGSISKSFTFTSVTRSKSTQADRGFTALGTISTAYLNRIAPVPNAQRLAQIW